MLGTRISQKKKQQQATANILIQLQLNNMYHRKTIAMTTVLSLRESIDGRHYVRWHTVLLHGFGITSNDNINSQ